MAKISKDELEETKKFLRSLLKPGQKIWGEVVWVNKMGTSRVIRLKIVHEEQIMDISWHVAKFIGNWNENHWGVRVGGGGMDMVFNTIYNLGHYLYPEGYQCIGDGCPCNDHSNPPYPPRDGKVFHGGDSGYCFRQA